MTVNPPPSVFAATTATEAWQALDSRGLEVPGRDDELVELLHKALLGKEDTAGEPSSFDEVLASVSLEQFVRAFFHAAVPYVDMLKDILRWFEQAGAKQGPRGWKLAWDGGDIPDLQYFRQWVAALERGAEAVEHPALSFDDCWTLWRKLGNAPAVAQTRELIGKVNYRGLPPSIADFAYHYAFAYDDISTLPHPGKAPAWMHSIFNIIRRAISELNAREINRPGAFAYARAVGYAKTDADGLALDSLCMLETDAWLLQLVAAYGALLASPEDQAVVGPHMEEWFATLPVTTFLAADSAVALAAFLDLPLWERRHEFFAAWIASKVIDACSEHELELLHDKGVISLPFKKTELARIVSARPERVLFSERRSPLSNPKGKGRLENVQPDLSLWHTALADDVCDLVVEVKHYRRPAKKSWADVIEDYAAAHGSATVVLVNYGQPGNALDEVPADIQGRCRLIGNLRPGHLESIARLKEAVRAAVGPVARSPRAGMGANASEVSLVVVDRSHSTQVESHVLREQLVKHATLYGAPEIAVAIWNVNLIWSAGADGFDTVASYPKNGETQFTAILQKMIEHYPEIIFITDADGDAAVDRDALWVEELGGELPEGMKVLRVRADLA